MSDLSSLLQIAPTTGATFMGINQGNQEKEAALKQMQLAQLLQHAQQNQEFAAQKQPLELERMRLGNQTAQAGIPGIEANSRLSGYNADIKRDTMGSEINSLKTDREMKAYKAVGSHLGSFASAIDNNPDAPAHAVLAQELQRLPPEVQSKFMDRYKGVPAAKLAEKLREDGDRILRENDSYAQAFDTTSLTSSAGIVRGAAHDASQERINQANNAAGRYDRSNDKAAGELTWDTVIKKAAQKGARAQHAALLSASVWAERNGYAAKAAEYMAQAEEIRPQATAETNNMTGKPGDVNVGEMANIPVNPNRSIAPPPRAGASAPQPAASQPGAVVPGQIVQGKGGIKYRFKGGDRNNKANWEEVK